MFPFGSGNLKQETVKSKVGMKKWKKSFRSYFTRLVFSDFLFSFLAE